MHVPTIRFHCTIICAVTDTELKLPFVSGVKKKKKLNAARAQSEHILNRCV
jgi:hypothetical protein